MIPDNFTIDAADWSNDADRDACMRVRETVFQLEQKVPREDEIDIFDPTARHVLARDLQGNPIGTGRLTTQHVIGRMAVEQAWRSRGVGAATLQRLIEQARALNYPSVELHAQTHAVAFYEKFGFAKYGDEFLECGIAHVHMRMDLAPNPIPERAGPSPRPDVTVVQVTDCDGAVVETLKLIAATRRELCIYTRDLDAALFDNEPVLDALKQLSISGRGVSIRVIVQEPRVPAQRGHRLIALSQRMPSVFALRTPTQDEDLHYPSAFVVNDVRGFYFRTLGSRFDGEAVNYAPGQHAQYLDFFNRVWERSEPSEELRQLAL
ncbi:MAG TPA: GNAT family N-acetyltransferase [Rudaea sp.]|jgi:predicted GNAT family N-acyltransferase|nr:GNAT family N-acetyltransferase [Rudaea sp.]